MEQKLTKIAQMCTPVHSSWVISWFISECLSRQNDQNALACVYVWQFVIVS